MKGQVKRVAGGRGGDGGGAGSGQSDGHQGEVTAGERGGTLMRPVVGGSLKGYNMSHNNSDVNMTM